MKTKEFVYLTNLVKTGKARFEFNRFFLRRSLVSWLLYKDNQPLIWAYSFFHFLVSEWFWVPFSIFLAWVLHAWWVIIVGISISWVVDSFIKSITPGFLRRRLLEDEGLLNYLWAQNPFVIMIESTSTITQGENIDNMLEKIGKRKLGGAQSDKFSKENIPSVTIVPPHPWQGIVNEFK